MFVRVISCLFVRLLVLLVLLEFSCFFVFQRVSSCIVMYRRVSLCFLVVILVYFCLFLFLSIVNCVLCRVSRVACRVSCLLFLVSSFLFRVSFPRLNSKKAEKYRGDCAKSRYSLWE